MNRSELELKTMGKIASAKYLSDGIPMNTTIREMIKESSLNPHQVARICEAANINTYDSLWNEKQAGDFTFDHADQEKIAEDLTTYGSLPVTETDADVSLIKDLLPPVEDVETEESLEKDAGIAKVASIIDNQLEAIGEGKLRKLRGKLAFYKNELDAALFEAEVAQKEAELTTIECLKTAALRGESVVPVYIAARATFPDKENEIKAFFEKAASELSRYGISFKEAARKYTEDARGNTAKAVVNKKHPILKHLDTVINSKSDIIGPCEKARDYVVSKIEVLDDALLSKKYRNIE